MVGQEKVVEGQGSNDWYWEWKWRAFRQGELLLDLCWGPHTGNVRLYTHGVPEASAALRQLLPLTIPVVHAAWSGDMVMSINQYHFGVATPENETRLPRIGDLSWDHKSGELAFTYGTAECRLPSGDNTVVVFGHLESQQDNFSEFCKERRFSGCADIVLRETAE